MRTAIRPPGFVRSAERSRGPLWRWPTVSGVVAVVAAMMLPRIRLPRWLASVLWSGDVGAAQTLLQVLATAVITATSVTLSLTVVAQQLASQQFSPRLLREFSRDSTTKWVLAVLTAAFVFAVTSLRHLRSDAPVPALNVVIAYALGVASLGAILAFITHMVKALRVDTMMLMVHDDTDRAITAFYPPYGDRSAPAPTRSELHPPQARMVTAAKSGFVRTIDADAMVSAACGDDAMIRLDVRAGDHVVQGAPLAVTWSRSGGADGRSLDKVADAVRGAVHLGYERTLEQDVAFGFRQLEDIAVKAMSPGINDPVTAATAVGHMADLLVRLTGRRVGPSVHRDEHGVRRVILTDRDLRYYLDLACGQLRRFAASEPTVLVALLRMLRDVAVSCRDDEQRSEVARAAALVADSMSTQLQDFDVAGVRDLRERVEMALAGDASAAYSDRSGETRSI